MNKTVKHVGGETIQARTEVENCVGKRLKSVCMQEE